MVQSCQMQMDTAALSQLLEQANAASAGKAYPKSLQLYQKVLAQTASLAHTGPLGAGRSPDVSPIPAEQQEEAKEIRRTALVKIGELQRLLGDQEAALATYEQYYQEAGTGKRAIDALVHIGTQYDYMGQNRRGLKAHRDALQLAEELDFTSGRARALLGMGIALYHLGHTEEAVERLRQSLPLLQQVHDSAQQLGAWNALGVTYQLLGRPDKTIVAYKAALEISRYMSDRHTAIILNNLGECYQNLFYMEQARIHHQEALALAQKIGLRSVEADIRRNLGVDLVALGQVEAGIDELNESLLISEEVQDSGTKMQVLYSLALAEIANGYDKTVMAHIQQLKTLAEQSRTRVYVARAYHALGLYYRQQDNVSKAEELWQEALFLAHETGERMLLWKIHAALAQAVQNPSMAAVHNHIAAEVIQQIADPIEDEALRQKFLCAPVVQAVLNAS